MEKEKKHRIQDRETETQKETKRQRDKETKRQRDKERYNLDRFYFDAN